MSTITNDDVRHLAQLSSLQMSDAEVESLRADIEKIINYIKQLDELDTDGVEPTYQVTGLQSVWRDDEIIDSSVSRRQLLALAAEQSDNCVKVPKVL
ncbi:MAG: Asp-tRNA(Asn)/Glu-tRNA(Gln) amidotransferase subunit GatC [Candidatus Nanosynbacter sp.]|nr:Asp-tRNA(Asn)/Glu-tRNA(Gln) amidotransferase subunit GatC [Candidatus Nanosynbacter sp.]